MKHIRIKKLEEFISLNDFVSLDSLCEKFNVSKNTIRRDIDELADKGIVVKKYGGVSPVEKKLMIPFKERTIIFNEEKEMIGKKAATFVNNNDIIFVDSGTTTMTMIPYLSHLDNVTVITNNLNAIVLATSYPNINIVGLCGALIRKTNSFVFTNNWNSFQNYNITKAFMGVTGLSLEAGATNSSNYEYDLKSFIVKKSKSIYVLADHSKFGLSSLLTYANIENIDYIITDKVPSEDFIDCFEKNNTNLVIAN